MTSKSKDLVKGIVKNAAPKSTYATDPNDPWSAKAGIAENVTSRRADLLKKFYKARGYNIDYVSKNQRVGQSKTDEFEKWKRDHGIYEDEQIEESDRPQISVGGIRKRENDEGYGRTTTKEIVQHHVHINGVPWKSFTTKDEADRVANSVRNKHPQKHVSVSPKTYYHKVTEETAPIDVKQIRSTTADSPTHKRMHQLNKAANIGTLSTVHPPVGSGLKEDNINDPQSACQSPFDGANTTDDVAPKKSKVGKMVKEIYAKRRLKEDLYDHEKDDKGPGTFGKAPKVSKKIEVNDDNEKGTNARMVLKGGTTLTGEKRDTIEIDPMLKNRSKTADYLSQDAKKEQLRTK